MAIVYPLNYPSAPGFRTAVISATNIVGVNASPFTAQAQTFQWPGEYWSIQVGLPPMTRDQAEDWISFLVSLRGAVGSFYLGDPAGTVPQGVATGTPLVNGAQVAMSRTLVTKGWTHGTTGILLAGDYLQVGTGLQQRLYKNLTDADSDSSGNATLDIFPSLREGISDNQAITTTNCKGTFRLAGNERQWSVDYTRFYGIDFKCVENF